MKKTIFIASCLILGVVSVFQANQSKESLDEFLLMNVEALATSEYYDITFCEKSGDVLCEEIGVRVAYVFEGYSLRK